MKLEKVEVGGISFKIRPETVDINVLHEVITADPYQLRAINLRAQPNIIDVGGHIGAFTRLAHTRWVDGKFWIYEANRRNWPVLKANLLPMGSKVTLFRGAAVGTIPENKRLVIRKDEANRVTGGWGIIYDKQAYEPDANTAFEEIENFYNLHDVIKDLDKVDILKLDCEGSEWSILKELSDEDLHKVDYLVAEIHCGALPHAPATYEEIRDRVLKHFVCPELERRPTCQNHDLFNIVACNRKLLPK